MKINTTIYGVPSHLYHTTYAPSDYTRASSLNTSSYPANPHLNRTDSNHQLVIREKPREAPLKNNQIITSNYHKQAKMSNHPISQYYPQTNINQTEMKSLRKKLEQIQRKVIQNTEDILAFKQKQINISNNSSTLKLQESLVKFTLNQKVIQKQFAQNLKKLQRQFQEIKAPLTQSKPQSPFQKPQQLDEKYLIKIKTILQERIKQETVKIKLIIQNQNNKLSNLLKQEINKYSHNATPIKSKLKYPFQPIKLQYQQFLEWSSGQTKQPEKGRLSTRQSSDSPRDSKYSNYSREYRYRDSVSPLCLSDKGGDKEKVVRMYEKEYCIDKQGYLLDEHNFYLTDVNNNMIRLNKQMLSLLKKQGLLKYQQ